MLVCMRSGRQTHGGMDNGMRWRKGPFRHTGSIWPPMHPARLRCSSLTDSRYARSSRLAGRVPRRPDATCISERALTEAGPRDLRDPGGFPPTWLTGREAEWRKPSAQFVLHRDLTIPVRILAEPAYRYSMHRKPAIAKVNDAKNRVLVRFVANGLSGSFHETCIFEPPRRCCPKCGHGSRHEAGVIHRTALAVLSPDI